MNQTEILATARITAEWLGIRIKNPALILRNMKPKIGVTTILWNEDFTLWIDRHYIAYSDNLSSEIVYVFADSEHISEELRSVCDRIKSEESPHDLKTLLSIKEQLLLADTAIANSGSGIYFKEELI